MSTQTIIRRTALLLAVTALSAVLLPAQAQFGTRAPTATNVVMKITPNGSDGNKTYYGVRCVNGTRGDVRIEHEAKRTCAVPQGGETRCQASWSIQRASEHVCTAGGG